MEQKARNETMVTVAVLVIVLLIVVGAVASAREKSSVAAGLNNSSVANTNQRPRKSGNGPRVYKDGNYVATSMYSTPENTETITLNITLKNGTIADTSAKASMISRESKEYAKDFIQNYKPKVVGQKIDGISLSRVSGSSLTSQGFNSAIEQIKNQAQS